MLSNLGIEKEDILPYKLIYREREASKKIFNQSDLPLTGSHAWTGMRVHNHGLSSIRTNWETHCHYDD